MWITAVSAQIDVKLAQYKVPVFMDDEFNFSKFQITKLWAQVLYKDNLFSSS